MNYILDDSGQPVPEPDVEKWWKWVFENVEARQIENDSFFVNGRAVQVSTIFLGMDKSRLHYDGWTEGCLFSTELFAPHTKMDLSKWFYFTRSEAEAGHAAVVAALRDGTPLPGQEG